MIQDIIEKLIVTKLFKKYPFLWNPKFQYRVHKSPSLDRNLSQPNSVRPIDPYLPKVHLNVILSPMSRSFQWSLTFGPPNQNPVNTSPLPHACHMSRSPHSPWFNHPKNIRWRIQAMQLIPSNPICLRSILTLSSHLRLGLPSGIFP